MINAVQLQITIVSTNTPSACTNPALTGWSHSAAAAAHGADPEPASFENSPRLIPFIRTAPKTAGCCLSESKCFLKNSCKNTRQTSKIHHNDQNRDCKIAYRHDRHYHIQDLNCRIFTKHYHSSHSNNVLPSYRSAEWKMHFLNEETNRIADHLTDTAPADQTGDCKQHRNHHFVSHFSSDFSSTYA